MLKNKPDLKPLQDSNWLQTRSAGFRTALMACAVHRRYEAGEALYNHGDPADGIHGVLDGGVRLTTPADDGQEYVLHQEGRGFWVGDLALFANAHRLVGVVATKHTEALFFPSAMLDRMVQQNPEYLRDFYVLSHENMQKALRIIANLGVTGTEKRLILRLLHLEEVAADADGWLQVSQEELAAMIAVSPPTLHRTLQRLIKQGLIAGGYGRLKLQDRPALIALCQS